MKFAKSFAVLFTAVFFANIGFAQTPTSTPAKSEEKPSISLGATFFSDYAYTLDPTSTDSDGNTYNPSSFNVARAYINVNGKISRFSFRFTPDIARETGTGSSLSGSLTFRVKYAFAQANLDGVFPKGSFVRLGIQQTPYVDYLEGIYRYRFQGPIFSDREGFTSSSDAGASVRVNLPSNFGDVHVGVYNGENYNKAEVNDQKALRARVSFRPLHKSLPGLRVAGFYDRDHYVHGAERTRLVGSITVEGKHLNAGFEYLDANDQISASKADIHATGYSVWATPKFGAGWEGLFRYDYLEPNTATSQERNRTIVGVAYWFPYTGSASYALLADYENVRISSAPTQKKLSLHALVNF